jgi:hypothetical protein
VRHRRSHSFGRGFSLDRIAARYKSPPPRWGRVGVGVMRPSSLAIVSCTPSRFARTSSFQNRGMRCPSLCRKPLRSVSRGDERSCWPPSISTINRASWHQVGNVMADRHLAAGTCDPSFDLSAVFARSAFPPRSCSAVKSGLAHVRRRRDISSSRDLGGGKHHPHPTLPLEGEGSKGSRAPAVHPRVRGLRCMAVRELPPATGSCSRRRSGSACLPTGRA